MSYLSELKKKLSLSEKTSRREVIRHCSCGIAAAAIGGGLVDSVSAESSPTHAPTDFHTLPSIRRFGVDSANSPDENARALQNGINWASERGGALLVEPSDRPYRVASGIILRQNSSLIGVHGPTPRGTCHPKKRHPVGSVFRIESEDKPFITVESATQLRGLQFWYPAQPHRDASKIVAYPPTVAADKQKDVEGVTLSNLTFYGEYTTFDFGVTGKIPSGQKASAELILFEHCTGYPLSGRFIGIDYCYDIPRILHCHVNPAIRRTFLGDNAPAIVDSVIQQKTFSYNIDHTDNAQLMDVFCFGVYGGVRLGPSTYGQLTNFNLDCVTIGIHKTGDSDFNRNWQIAQGSIIANAGKAVEKIHPIIIDGKGHTAISNVEAFSGKNGALTTHDVELNGKRMTLSNDYLLVEGKDPITVNLNGCRMGNYYQEDPLTIRNPNARVTTWGCYATRAHDNYARPLKNGDYRNAKAKADV